MIKAAVIVTIIFSIIIMTLYDNIGIGFDVSKLLTIR